MPLVSSPAINSNNLILVEGKDEVNFLSSLFKHIQPQLTKEEYEKSSLLKFSSVVTAEIRACGGINLFHTQFNTLIDLPGFDQVTSLAIFRDADSNAQAAFMSVAGTLKQYHFAVPTSPVTFTNSTPRVGIYIIPGNDCSGMLETLCLQSQQPHPVMECVEAFMQCVVTKEVLQPKNIYKAKCQAFLAAMPEIVGSVGLSADKGYWNFDHECFDGLKRFLLEIISH